LSRDRPESLVGRCLLEDGVRAARLTFDRRILEVERLPPRPEAPLVLPGFIDLHVHGGGGACAMEGEAAVRTLARLHARHGTTALLATTMTAPPAEIEAALDGIARVASAPEPGEARVLGAHLEGPFINPARLGAQPPFACDPEPGLVARLALRPPVRIVTLAPELPGASEAIRRLAPRGVRVQLGHSEAGFEEVRAALLAGARGITHLGNAMSGLHQRSPGLLGAALALARNAEIIPDLLHVHAGLVLAAARAIPGLYAVTDATAAAGMPDGRYRLGRREVVRAGDGVRLADGTLAGSTLTMDRALRNLVAIGLPLEDAARRLTTLPAAYLGDDDRGRLERGALADMVVLDGDLHIERVYIGGEPLDRMEG
jgi:N-acetylglucosamine-6-phosphate deacetylase